jgi:hypothetical protein
LNDADSIIPKYSISIQMQLGPQTPYELPWYRTWAFIVTNRLTHEMDELKPFKD